MHRLIWAFVVRIWQNRFSHDVAHVWSNQCLLESGTCLVLVNFPLWHLGTGNNAFQSNTNSPEFFNGRIKSLAVCIKTNKSNKQLYRTFEPISWITEPHHEKTCLCHMPRTKAQIACASVTLTLHGTRCVHTRWTTEKWNSSLIFILCFYIVFVQYLWSFGINLVK